MFYSPVFILLLSACEIVSLPYYTAYSAHEVFFKSPADVCNEESFFENRTDM